MDLTRRTLIAGVSASAFVLRPLRGGAAPTPLILEAAPAKLRLRPAPAAETDVFAYNRVVPGPLIRARLGDTLHIRLVNRLTVPTTLCWHGVRLANVMDGVAGLTQAPVLPGQSFDYTFTPPDAGLYWYHPHVATERAGRTGDGLYGLLLIEETIPPSVDHDILAIIGDGWRDAMAPTAKGQEAKAQDAKAQNDGPVLVNGRPVPLASSEMRPGARVRLRLLNASGGRVMRVALAGLPASIVAIDGQPSELFPPAGGMVPIGPGSRFELIGDMPPAPGRTATLGLLGPSDASAEGSSPLLRFTTSGAPAPARAPIERLAPNPLLPVRIPLERSLKRDLVVGGTGATDFTGKPLFKIKRGGAVTLALKNKTDLAVQTHVHGHVFRILHDLDDGWDPYWRDSILLAPGKTKHIAFVADNPGQWAVDSLVTPQGSIQVAWFEVT